MKTILSHCYKHVNMIDTYLAVISMIIHDHVFSIILVYRVSIFLYDYAT